MAEYLVTWVIDVDGDNPEDAARTAWSVMRDPIHIPVFSVLEIKNGLAVDNPVEVDMMEEQGVYG